MKSVLIPALLTASLALQACSGFSAAGVRADPLPDIVAARCPHPSSVDPAGDWEIYAGRLGDALLECGETKAVAVQAYDDLRATFR